MANTFKVTTASSVATSASDNDYSIYQCPSSTTTVVLSVLLANKHTTSIKASVLLSSDTGNSGNNNNRNSGNNQDAYIIRNVSITEETSLEIMSGQKYVLQATDSIKVLADNENLDVVLSYMEVT